MFDIWNPSINDLHGSIALLVFIFEVALHGKSLRTNLGWLKKLASRPDVYTDLDPLSVI